MFVLEDETCCYGLSIIILPNSYSLKYGVSKKLDTEAIFFSWYTFIKQRRNNMYLMPLVLNEFSDLIGPGRLVQKLLYAT